MRWATSPERCQRVRVVSTSSSNRPRMPARHAWRAEVARRSASSASPAMSRTSSRPSATRRSSVATATASPTVRTEWSRPMPASQSGYQRASAMRAMPSSAPFCLPVPSWTRTRSRSDHGASSRRPRAPTATRAVPLPDADRRGAGGEPEVVQFDERLAQGGRAEPAGPGRRGEQRGAGADQVDRRPLVGLPRDPGHRSGRHVATSAGPIPDVPGAPGSRPRSDHARPLRARSARCRGARHGTRAAPSAGGAGRHGAGTDRRGPVPAPWHAGRARELEGVRPALAGAHAHHGLDRGHPDLAVTDLAGAGGLGDRVEHLLRGRCRR